MSLSMSDEAVMTAFGRLKSCACCQEVRFQTSYEAEASFKREQNLILIIKFVVEVSEHVGEPYSNIGSAG